jgi:hypothetical protein
MLNPILRATLFAVSVVAAGDVGITAGAPVLSLDAVQYCSGSQWRLTIVNGSPYASIRFMIRLGDQEVTSIVGETNDNGTFAATGTAWRWAEGRYSAQVHIDGLASNVVFYDAPRCAAIDLNGTYFAPSSQASLSGAIASATTNFRGDRRGAGQVYEVHRGLPVVEGTFTPFSDDAKKPRALDNLDLRGTRFRCDVDLHNVNLWIYDAEFFQIGAGRQADPDDTRTEEFFVFIYRSGPNQFALYMETDWAEYRDATTYYSAPDETRFRIHVDIDAAGTEALLTVVPLNGLKTGTEHAVNRLLLDLRHDNFTSASFFAGFTQNYLHTSSQAKASLDQCIVEGHQLELQ